MKTQNSFILLPPGAIAEIVSSLRIDDSTTVIDHELKAGILFNAFKDRLSCYDFSTISYNLQALI